MVLFKFILREVFLIFMVFMSTTMTALAIFVIVRYICGSIGHAEQNTKKSEKENEHIRQMQALKLTALQEKTKHLTQERFSQSTNIEQM